MFRGFIIEGVENSALYVYMHVFLNELVIFFGEKVGMIPTQDVRDWECVLV